ncbi:RAMP superfamily protein [Marinomonas spartinae]|uniref:type III-B CRISPR module RAMP protein Cmr6 n=1 Tax=Marinomonas spartinae TaxID=1792290 RepID=UPI000808D923|nr:type III-B CRISPR module RAMP protein Cmr6 [Marinomonas spartinae]SBS35732.1 RAMP superfamily protein [Marinomonas spartinae]
MIPLVRKKVEKDFRQSDCVNPSLLLQKGMLEAENNGAKNSDSKSDNKKTVHLKELVKLPASDEYKNAFNRWFDPTSDENRFSQTVMTLENRLLIGLTDNAALETGCSLSRNYGMPYIPGSSVKGVVREWAIKHLPNSAVVLEQLFGTYDSDQPNRVSATVTFHDAWWIPFDKDKAKPEPKPFVLDIVTTHHQDYYNGQQDKPTDKDSPIPNHQLAVHGSFLFVLEGAPDHVELCQKMLAQALQDNGIGAKTAAGYGYFKGDDQEALDLLSYLQKLSRERRMSDEEKREYDIKQLTENQLIQMFSKDLKRTQERNDFQALIEKVKRFHSEVIESWKNVTKVDSKNRFKAYQFLKGK